MTHRNYVLTEEVTRQTVEVVFNLHSEEWFICFSNPTAGPWKLIRLWTPGGSREVSPYLKKDVRPDLVLQSFQHKILIYLEAKRSVTELLSVTQLEKSARMFLREIERFGGLLSAFESGVPYVHLIGFAFPSEKPQQDLAALHEALLQWGGLPSDHYVVFLVIRKPSKDLNVVWHLAALRGDIGQLQTQLQTWLPRAAVACLPDRTAHKPG